MLSSYLRFLVAAYCSLAIVRAIPIDNGVEGEPEIECAANSITVNFNTRNDFQGHVYVKGRFGEPGCKSDEGGRRVAGIKLGFEQCGTQRTRSLNPKGVFVQNTVVITFHPQFLTKVDRAYTIQCFYMEADKTVSQELEVSEITTAFQTQTVPMPVCQYEILEGGPDGQPVKFATIGQQVYHKWVCTTETTDIFCAIVHSCFVDDGAGNQQKLLDESGCAIDKYLLQNLEYPSDLIAGREAHVFKYADKPALFFQCQVTISIKEPGQQCPRPQCGDPGNPLRPNGPIPQGTPAPIGSPRPRGTAAAPAPAAGQPPRAGSSAKPPTVPGPIGARNLFLAPLQSQLQAGSSRLLPSLSSSSTNSQSSSSSKSSSPTTPRAGTVTPVQPLPAAPRVPSPVVAVAALASSSTPLRPASTLPTSASTPSSARPLIKATDSQRPDQTNAPLATASSDLAAGPGGFDFPDRRRRARAVSMENVAGTWDLRAQPITTLDIDDDILDDSLNRRSKQKRDGPQEALEKRQSSDPAVCISPVSLGLFLAFVVAFSISTTVVGLMHCLRRSSK